MTTAHTVINSIINSVIGIVEKNTSHIFKNITDNIDQLLITNNRLTNQELKYFVFYAEKEKRNIFLIGNNVNNIEIEITPSIIHETLKNEIKEIYELFAQVADMKMRILKTIIGINETLPNSSTRIEEYLNHIPRWIVEKVVYENIIREQYHYDISKHKYVPDNIILDTASSKNIRYAYALKNDWDTVFNYSILQNN